MMSIDNVYEAVKARLEDAVQNIFVEMHKELGIMSGDVSPDAEFQLGYDTRLLAKAIQLTLEEQYDNNERIEIESGYVPEMDRTFIMEHTYRGGELKASKVVGFYSGEPNETDTELYKNKGAECEY